MDACVLVVTELCAAAPANNTNNNNVVLFIHKNKRCVKSALVDGVWKGD